MRRVEARPIPYFPGISFPNIGIGRVADLFRRTQTRVSKEEVLNEVVVPRVDTENLYASLIETRIESADQYARFARLFSRSGLSRYFRQTIKEGEINLKIRDEYPEGVHMDIGDGEVRFQVMQEVMTPANQNEQLAVNFLNGEGEARKKGKGNTLSI